MEREVVAENLARVRAKIRIACEKSSRSEDEVTLVAVSKLKPVSDLVGAVQAGVWDLGENYVQEWKEKTEHWPDTLQRPRWHFIGPLQTNKVKFIVGHVDLIHTLDRSELVQAIAKRATQLGIVQRVLIQVKIGDESTKHGVTLDEAPRLIAQTCQEPSLQLEGLMALPPFTENEKLAKSYFHQLMHARERWITTHPEWQSCLQQISMGTSGDFLWAIEEGATIVRVGTAIFGARE